MSYRSLGSLSSFRSFQSQLRLSQARKKYPQNHLICRHRAITKPFRNMSSSTLLSSLPEVPGTDPPRSILDSFRIAIAKKIADALPPLTIEQVYEGVDYGKKGVDFTVALPRFR